MPARRSQPARSPRIYEIGVVNDEEIGQPSEIKEVVYAG